MGPGEADENLFHIGFGGNVVVFAGNIVVFGGNIVVFGGNFVVFGGNLVVFGGNFVVFGGKFFVWQLYLAHREFRFRYLICLEWIYQSDQICQSFW